MNRRAQLLLQTDLFLGHRDVKIRIIGGGPAGLFFAYLMGRANAGHDVRVYERDPKGATYGWGLVFSDVALSFVREVAPEVYDSVTAGQVVFGDMEIVHQGQHVTLAGNTFYRMARIDLLTALRHHCHQVGVGLAFDHRCDDVTALADADLIVAADGANSTIRTRYSEQFEPTLDERPRTVAVTRLVIVILPVNLYRPFRDAFRPVRGLDQFSTLSPSKAAKSFSLIVTSTSPCTCATAAIWPSTNGAGRPSASRRARSLPCHVAAASS